MNYVSVRRLYYCPPPGLAYGASGLMSRFSEINSCEKSTLSNGAVGSERHRLDASRDWRASARFGEFGTRSPGRSASRSLPVAPPCVRILALERYVTIVIRERLLTKNVYILHVIRRLKYQTMMSLLNYKIFSTILLKEF